MKNDPHETGIFTTIPSMPSWPNRSRVGWPRCAKRVGDDGSHYPECEKIVREFWDYDEADQAKARKISAEYLARRKGELEAEVRNVKTSGKP